MSYLADVAALARKDLRLELRARDTLPAMLLFVLSTLVVFHFALPTGAVEVAAQGLLWVALVFTALLGLARAWAPEREGGALDRLVLAPSDRSAIWLGKSAAVFVFLTLIELVRAAGIRALLLAAAGGGILGVLLWLLGICAVGTLLAAMATASRTRELILPLLFRLAIPLVVGGVGSSVSTEPGRYLVLSGCTTPSSRYCAGRPLSTSSPARVSSRFRRPAALQRPSGWRSCSRSGSPRGRRPGSRSGSSISRPDRPDGVRVLRLGAWKALSAPLEGRRALRPQATSRSTRARSSGR